MRPGGPSAPRRRAVAGRRRARSARRCGACARGRSLLDVAMAVSVVAALVLLLVWFFFFAEMIPVSGR